jgi:hypothetical protein
MKKPAAKLREDITRLQEELKQAETREAERIGRIALKARLGDFDIEPSALQSAFEEIASRFRKDGKAAATSSKATVESGKASGQSIEA